MNGFISKSFIEQLNQRTNLVSLIEKHIELRKRSGKYWACCPFHDEKTASFCVDEQHDFYHCFGCGAHGDGIRFLMDLNNLSFIEAVEDLATFNGMKVIYEKRDDNFQHEKRNDKFQLGLQCLQRAADFFCEQLQQPQGARARAYLRSRGVKKSTAATFKIGFAPGGNALLKHLSADFAPQLLEETSLIGKKDAHYYDYFRERLIFPIQNVKGEIIAFGARAFGDERPKYLNSKQNEWFNKSNELYGLHHFCQLRPRQQQLLICEGYMDVVKLWQFGINYAVAALGTAFGGAHVKQLSKRASKIYIAFDGDAAGDKAAQRALRILFENYQEKQQWRFLFLPEGDDPDSLLEKSGSAAMLNLLENARSPSQFLLRILKTQLGAQKTPENIAKLAQSAQQWLKILPQSIYRSVLANEIINKFKLPNFSFNDTEKHEATSSQEINYRAANHYVTNNNVVNNKKICDADTKLMAIAAIHPDLIKNFSSCDYHRELGEEFPYFWRMNYVLQCAGISVANVEKFLENYRNNNQLRQQMELYKNFSIAELAREFSEILQNIDELLREKEKRLEKLGNSPRKNYSDKS